MAEPTKSTKRPLAVVQFSGSVRVPWADMPVTLWKQGMRGAPQAFLVPDRDVVVMGELEFPLHGGMVAYYQIAKAAMAERPAD